MATKKPAVESAAPASDKKKALETCMAQIERAYGKGSIMRLGGALLFEVGIHQPPDVESILAGSGYENIQTTADPAGIWRVVEGTANN